MLSKLNLRPIGAQVDPRSVAGEALQPPGRGVAGRRQEDSRRSLLSACRFHRKISGVSDGGPEQ